MAPTTGGLAGRYTVGTGGPVTPLFGCTAARACGRYTGGTTGVLFEPSGRARCAVAAGTYTGGTTGFLDDGMSDSFASSTLSADWPFSDSARPACALPGIAPPVRPVLLDADLLLPRLPRARVGAVLAGAHDQARFLGIEVGDRPAERERARLHLRIHLEVDRAADGNRQRRPDDDDAVS